MKIIKPVIGGHDGSSFRELLDLWKENGYCEVVDGPEQRDTSYLSDPDSPQAKCWVNEIGDILLYDFPLLDRLQHDYNLCLFSNTYTEGPKNKKWVFWPKHSRLYHSAKNDLRRNLNDRNIKLGFVGSPTNEKRNDLASEWSIFCDAFYFDHKQLVHFDYLNILSHMKYGLCLCGVGPKCLRDIELMGMGTVPVFTEGVSTDYHDQLVENEHYIFAESPEEGEEKIADITDEQWETMSSNCIEWFEKNCSVKGSFETTVSIIQNSEK